MRVVAIIQARMGSRRLPGKVLKDLSGQSVLARVVNRLRRANLLDELLVATTDRPLDEGIAQECGRCSVPVFRGAEEDVLDRYFQAARSTKAEAIVRITSDCPLIDPEITDNTIRAFLSARPDYASNCVVRTYPRGLDTEVMTIEALERAWRAADQPYQRAHVTPYIYEHPGEFGILSVTSNGDDYSSHRWTVDTADDLEFIQAIYSRFRGRDDFLWRDVLKLLDREPELLELNRSVAQKPLHAG